MPGFKNNSETSFALATTLVDHNVPSYQNAQHRHDTVRGAPRSFDIGAFSAHIVNA